MSSQVGRAAAGMSLTPAVAAAWMGASLHYVYSEIEAGILVATDLAKNGERANYRIAFADFASYLRTVRWPRLPQSPAEVLAAARALKYQYDAEDKIPSSRRLIHR